MGELLDGYELSFDILIRSESWAVKTGINAHSSKGMNSDK